MRAVVNSREGKSVGDRQDIFLKPALPYIVDHKGKTVIFVLPEELIAPDQRASFWQDLISCHNLGLRCVLCVEPARPRPLSKDAQRRVVTQTELAQLQVDLAAKKAECISHLTRAAHDLGKHILILEGNWLLAQPLGIIDAVDYQRGGKVRRVDKQSIDNALDAGAIVLMNNPAPDKRGDSYLLSTVEMVTALCQELAADKLILCTKTLPAECRMRAVAVWTLAAHEKKLPPRILQFMRDAEHYCRVGQVKRVHLMPVEFEDALLSELFTSHGIGMMIHRDMYEQLDTPEEADLDLIKQLIFPLEEAGILRPRSLKALAASRQHFRVIKQDGVLVGCAALSPLKGNPGYAELECVVVAPAFNGHGYGGRLLRSMERLALEMQYHHLVVMSTQSVTWFQERGYALAAPTINIEVSQACKERNPKILIKQLGQ